MYNSGGVKPNDIKALSKFQVIKINKAKSLPEKIENKTLIYFKRLFLYSGSERNKMR